MAASNMTQLNNMLMRELRKAMDIASNEILADMYEETGKFYTQGNPKYERTGALGDTPETTPLASSVSANGGQVSFDARLNTSHQYTTGSKPNMEEVLLLANSGIPFTTKNGYPAKPTVGKKGFWEASEKKMQKTLDDTLNKFFK